MNDEERISLKLDQDLKTVEKLIVQLIKDASLFRKFAKNPRKVLELEVEQLTAVFPEDYDFSEFIETVHRARKFFSRRKADLSAFEKFIRVSGNETKLYQEAGSQRRFDCDYERTVHFKESTETRPGTFAEKNMGWKIRTSERFDGLNLSFGIDFGPLVDPDMLAELLKRKKR